MSKDKVLKHQNDTLKIREKAKSANMKIRKLDICCDNCLHFTEKEKPCKLQCLGIQQPNTEFCSKFEEKCCGGCAWFAFETMEGDGQCIGEDKDGFPMMCTRCDSKACDRFISREEMRHHLAVLLQDIRWDEDTEFIRYSADSDEATEAKKFAYQYMKAFSRL